jgi:hypothetical protein
MVCANVLCLHCGHALISCVFLFLKVGHQTISSRWISWKSPLLLQTDSHTKKGQSSLISNPMPSHMIASLQVHLGVVQKQENQPHYRGRASQVSFHPARVPLFRFFSYVLIYCCAPQYKLDPQSFSQEPNQPMERRAGAVTIPYSRSSC